MSTKSNSTKFVGLFFFLVALIMRSPVLDQIHEGYLGGVTGDSGLYVWIFNFLIQELFNFPWFETNIFHPYSCTLAWSDNFIFPSIIGGALSYIGISSSLAYNLILLISYTAAGFSTYLLSKKILNHDLASVAAGTAFLVWSYHTAMMGHPQLQFSFLIPLAMTLALNLSNRPTFLAGALFGGVISLAFYTTVYYAIFALLLSAVIFLALAIQGKISFRPELFLSILGILAGLSLIIPALPPYLTVMQTFTARGIYEPFYFAADSWSYLSSPPISQFYSFTAQWSHSEANLFPGLTITGSLLILFLTLRKVREFRSLILSFLTLFLLLLIKRYLPIESHSSIRFASQCLAWICLASLFPVLRAKGASQISLILSITTVAFIFSLGPIGSPNRGELLFSPYAVLYNFLPGFGAIRAIGRIGIITYLGLTLCFAWLIARFTVRGLQILSLSIPLLLLENFSLYQPIEKLTIEQPLRTKLEEFAKDDSAVIILPFASALDKNGEVVSWGDFAQQNVQAMLHSLGTRVKIVNGYSGQKTKLMRELPRELRGFPDNRSLGALCRISHLRFAVIKDSIPSERELAFDSGTLRYSQINERWGYYQINCRRSLGTNPELLISDSDEDIEIQIHSDEAGEIEISEITAGSTIPIAKMSMIQGLNKIKVVLPDVKANRAAPRTLSFSSKANNSYLVDSWYLR